MCNLCNRFRPHARARAFRVRTTQRFHQLRHHIARHFPRPASQENADSTPPPGSVELQPVPRSAPVSVNAASATPPESVELQPVPRSARAPVVEPQVAETQPLI